jgi:hypothetical protein
LTFSGKKSIVATPLQRGFPSHGDIQLCCEVRTEAGRAAMVQRSMRIAIILLVGGLGFTASPSVAQQAAAGTKVVQITGLTGVKAKAKGTLTPENGSLEFANSKVKVSVAIHSMEDVLSGNDSQRVFRGTLGTLTMIAPYGGGRFLSLFRSKVDILTIQYRDADGALHGAIFTMPLGQADLLKKELVSQGAHTSVPIQESSATSDAKADAAKEKKP